MRHVCFECGHSEVRDLAPLACPMCGSEYVTEDDTQKVVELTEKEIEALVQQALKRVSNG